MKRIVILGATAVAAFLLISGSICAQFIGAGAAGAPNRLGSYQLVASLSPVERELIRQVDVADCSDRVMAGQETGLEASESAPERSALMLEPGLVTNLCSCKFEATAKFLTKQDIVTSWLSPASSVSGANAPKTQAMVDGAFRDCAETMGLRTEPTSEGLGLW